MPLSRGLKIIRKNVIEMTEQDIRNAISNIQYASKDLMNDFNYGHIGTAREDLEMIQDAVSTIDFYLSKVHTKQISSVNKKKSNQHIVDWYIETYPDDADSMYGANDDLLFSDLVFEMVNGKDFYDTMQVRDSVVRERIFEGIADAYDVDYNDIYSLWLGEINEISNDAKNKFGIQ